MNKKLIRLTESDLHRIVKESVNRVIHINEWEETEDDVLNRLQSNQDKTEQENLYDDLYKKEQLKQLVTLKEYSTPLLCQKKKN